MIGLNYCTPEDIAEKILLKKSDWPYGIPFIELIGNTGEFGTLKFSFGDEIVRFKIFIKDREAILDAAHIAVHNFSTLIRNRSEVWNDSILTDKIMEAIRDYENINRNISR